MKKLLLLPLGLAILLTCSSCLTPRTVPTESETLEEEPVSLEPYHGRQAHL